MKQSEDTVNILFITHYSGMYGANQSMCALILELRSRYNINPYVMIPNRGSICDFLDTNKIAYKISHYYWWVNSNKGVFQKILNIRKQIINYLRINKWVKLWEEKKIELVYSNSITINIGSLISKKMQVPHLWHIRETLQHYQFQFSLGEIHARSFLKKGADRFIVISNFIKNTYEKLLPDDKVVRVFNGINTSNSAYQLKTNTTDVVNICIVGVVSEKKHQLDAIKALDIIVNTNKRKNIYLHIVGSCKAGYMNQLKKYIEEHHLENNVVIYGHRDDVPEILQKMHIGLMCSENEAFGRATLEYMLYGLPVIASKSGANAEIIVENKNGFLYKLNEYKELAQKIEYYILNPNQISTMGKYAASYVSEHFSSENTTQEVFKVMEGLFKTNNNI